MDSLIKDMLNGYIGTFSAYSTDNAQLSAEVQDWINRANEFGSSIDNVADFYIKFTESGLAEEFSGLVTKLAMQGMNSQPQNQEQPEQVAESTSPRIPSVKEFVQQYQIPYDEVKKAEYRKRAEAAYEKVFDVANQTDSMLEAQIIIEKERLLWKIVSEDYMDIMEPIHEAADPLFDIVYKNTGLYVEKYSNAQSEEELLYDLEKMEYEKFAIVNAGQTKMTFAASLMNNLIGKEGYITAKKIVWAWESDEKAKYGLGLMISARQSILNLLKYLEEDLNVSFDEFINDDTWRIWCLSPMNADALGRIKVVLNHKNFEMIKSIINNEIRSSLTEVEILQRNMDKEIYAKLDDTDSYKAKADDIAAKMNSEFTYFRYLDKLKGAAANEISKTVKDVFEK